jgi:hypothetical protein
MDGSLQGFLGKEKDTVIKCLDRGYYLRKLGIIIRRCGGSEVFLLTYSE